MPVYKDPERGSWYVKTYYTDWQGRNKQKMKRGFKLQREAKEWERSFLEIYSQNPDISFPVLVGKYEEYIKPRIKKSTYKGKFSVINRHILPYFKNKAVSEVTPADVAAWQSEVLKKGLSGAYVRLINVELVSLFTYAKEYCGLVKSPCGKLIGTDTRRKEITFWTLEQYLQFIAAVKDIRYFTAFEILYYGGLRVGELLALTPGDFDFVANTISITKTYSRIHGQDVITSPKTEKSRRTIYIPEFLASEVQAYIRKIYGIGQDDRLFPFLKETLTYNLRKGCKETGIDQIRVHDLRHSHASLLINQGAAPLLVSERLGHEDVRTTLNIYAHLYPSQHSEMAKTLDNLKR